MELVEQNIRTLTNKEEEALETEICPKNDHPTYKGHSWYSAETIGKQYDGSRRDVLGVNFQYDSQFYLVTICRYCGKTVRKLGEYAPYCGDGYGVLRAIEARERDRKNAEHLISV